ncbi:MAG TPA: hypothetical protein PLA74_06535 [Syntrophales bacterium]|nr:hypothetical protein [Syntrophales bacterium]
MHSDRNNISRLVNDLLEMDEQADGEAKASPSNTVEMQIGV